MSCVYFVLFITVDPWFCSFETVWRDVTMPPCGRSVGSETERVGTVAGRKLIPIHKR